MTKLRLSVVVVSLGRPEALRRCLLSLSQQAQSGAEVVVVADAEGLEAARGLPVAGALKLLLQHQPNISAARNVGIRAAAGDIVAFIDDDAVAEPVWAGAILKAFEQVEELEAVTGPVLGRNGISLQWGSMAVNGLAQDIPVDPNAAIRVGFARKLQGTNMAVRRNALQRHGGFDEAFAFYLDDTDLAFRMWQTGDLSAYVQSAVVHHGYAASSRRTADRVPLTLFDVGASTAVYLRKHALPEDHGGALLELEVGQSVRLLRLAKAGKLDSAQMQALLETLKDGIEAGRTRASVEADIGPQPEDFEAFQLVDPPPHQILSGRSFQLKHLRTEATKMIAKGHPVSLFAFEPTPRKHKVRFTDGGWWEQTGGLFGPSVRSGPRLQFGSFKRRLAQEVRRISATRCIQVHGDDN